MLGEDVEDQRDPVDDVAFEQLLQVPLLGRRELVVEDHDVDIERLCEQAQLLGLALAHVQRGIGGVAALQLDGHRLGAGGVGETRELVETGLGLLGRVQAESRAHEERALVDDAEIDLGRGEPSPAAIEVALAHDDHPSRSMSVSKTCTTGPPRRTVGPSSTSRSPPGTVTRTCAPTVPRRCITAADAHAPVPHDCVSPAPRSHTRIRIRSGASTVTNSTFTRAGKRGSCSSTGPTRARSTASGSSTAITQCGLPIPAASPV